MILAHARRGVSVLAIVLAACSSEGAERCPATVLPEDPFVPPAPYPEVPPDTDSAWFGSNELWTVLPVDGSYAPRKSIWWSDLFEGGEREPVPEIAITYERLNSHAEPTVSPAPGTHGFTEQSGAFMVNGLDPEAPGCWRATAFYRGAELTYTFQLE